MNKSIVSSKRCCYICGTTESLHKHHTIYGTGKRKLADEDGLFLNLCASCHDFIHHHPKRKEMDDLLKKLSQEKWQSYYCKTKEDFIKRYGKSYL